MALIYDNML